MRLRCVACGYRDEDGWRFPTPPVVTEVRAGGPAALAGLLPGDVLVAIDGAPLGTRAGDARFSRLGPGDRARWTVRRGDRLLEVAWTLGG
jgi:S1-C subfamily serine protease